MAKYAQLVPTGLPGGVLVTIKDPAGRQVANIYPEPDAQAPNNRAVYSSATGGLNPAVYLPNGTYTVAWSGGSQTVTVSGAAGEPPAAAYVDQATQAELDAAGVAASGTYGAADARATQPTDSRPYWLSNSVKDLAVSPAAGDRVTTLTATAGWEGTGVQEPNVWYYGGAWHMLYTGSWTSPALGYATAPSPVGPWTKNSVPVIGSGHGGMAGSALHSNVYREGTTLYAYFCSNTSSALYVATADVSAPTVWTLSGTTFALPAGATQWGNVEVYKNGSTYYMLHEVFRSSWLIGLGTLAGSPLGALTVTQTTLPTLQTTSAGSTSNPKLFKDGSTYVLYYHAGHYGSVPTQIHRATSTDLVTWTKDNNGQPFIDRAAATEVDQVCDIEVAQDASGQWWAFWSANDNITQVSSIMVAPMLPTLRRLDSAGNYVRADALSDPTQSARIPRKPSFAQLAADQTTSSASLVDVGLTLDFIPTSTRVLVTLEVEDSNSGTNVHWYAIRCPNGTPVVKSAGQTYFGSGGVQRPLARTLLFTGLTPGVVTQFIAQWRTSGGTAQCRPVGQPDAEFMTLRAADADQKYGPNNL